MTVQPIISEIGRYRCESRSKADAPFHLVDLLEDECGCRDWICNHRAYKQRTGLPYRCMHILKCREHLMDGVIESLREAQLSR